MNKTRTIAVIAPVFLCLVCGFNANAFATDDLTIVSRVTTAKGPPTTSTQYLTQQKMRMSDGKTDTIVDLANGRLVLIDHKKKKYSETTFEEMRQHFAELEGMLDSNPMMAKMLGGAADIDVQKTSETREIAGHTCTKVILTMGKSFAQTSWVTDELDFPIEYYDASKALFAMMGPMATRFEKMLDEMKKIGGFPLATDSDIKVMGRDASSSSEVVEIKKGPVPADTFAPPAGYKKSKKSPFGEK